MKQLIEVIQIVADKYKDNVNLIITNKHLTLEYLIIKDDGEKDMYKTLRIEEFEDKLKVTLFPEKKVMLIDVPEIENIIITLSKQSKPIYYSSVEVKYIKKKYSKGTRLELLKMYDLLSEVPPHSIGTVDHVDDMGHLHMNWNNGETTSLVVGVDEFKILKE